MASAVIVTDSIATTVANSTTTTITGGIPFRLALACPRRNRAARSKLGTIWHTP
jgi:hypothetical protein